MIGLTKRQADLLAFLIDYDAKHGRAPTVREMAAALDVANAAVHRILVGLEGRGRIRRLYHRARAIEIIAPSLVLPGQAELAKATDDQLAALRKALALEISCRTHAKAFARADAIMAEGER